MYEVANYALELQDMKKATKQEFIASLKSSGFSKGASIYRGVTRHHQQGRWQVRIGCVAGNKDLYFGTFATEEVAAEAYDIAAIKFRGMNAVTNFEINRYDVEAISSSSLPFVGFVKRLKSKSSAGEASTAAAAPKRILYAANARLNAASSNLVC
ncbi:AP2-like ethylene-responsive transcription factor AIL6 [Tanacetum coccineum]